MFIPALSAGFNHRPLGFRRPLRMPPGALPFCLSEAKAQAHRWLGQVRAASLCCGGPGTGSRALGPLGSALLSLPSPSGGAAYLPSTLVFLHGLGGNQSISQVVRSCISLMHLCRNNNTHTHKEVFSNFSFFKVETA